MDSYHRTGSDSSDRTRTISASARVGLAAAALIGGGYVTQAYGATCESLLALQLPKTTITDAQSIPAGTYQPPGSATAFSNLPAFCRVTATVNPVPDSSIGIEVWLPTATWNGKYQQSGSHGFAGRFFWGEMTRQLQRGYATGVTDEGHKSVGPGPFDVSWAFGHPEKIVDIAWRGVHELAVNAKLIIAAYYGRPQQYAYFNGCSKGGAEGMKEAQLFPNDFEGIIAGGPAAFYTHGATEQLVMSTNLKNAGIQGASGAAVLTLAQNATTAKCDAKDGVQDGLINNPLSCHWNPATLVCKGAQDPSTCITQIQAAAIESNTDAVRDRGQYVMSGMAPGSEFDQIRFGYNLGLAPFGIANYQVALNDPTWDGSTFNLHTDLPILDDVLGGVNAIDDDLSAFAMAGGKLIAWQGWDDAAFTPGQTVKYYNQVVDRTGDGKLENVQGFYRLFMLPGVGHCGTGPGPDNIGGENQTAFSHDPEHDVVNALETWVEKGIAPSKLIATKYNNNDPTQGVELQRPICPYPSEAVYIGSGFTNDASSFVCADPRDAETP